ncbi:MAG TPA: indole-3-glycerol phosphate synthase TrpC [Rhizomicrobium sp.]|jgi:indole-3-glycerol phosphate synthase|nr:indole-3-glycerol phosphate synthase TrpC [Rhizomicrobium sp.]
MTILDKIAAYKRVEVEAAKRRISRHELERQISGMSAPRGFRAQLQTTHDTGAFGLIAEIKKASPSKGIIREDFDPPVLARAYENGGATCLSVLTDKPSFQGDVAFIPRVRAASTLPVLRKDFMLDPFQVAEARAAGADCILIILAMIDDTVARDLIDTSKRYQMDALVEVHDEAELNRALALDADMIGINNRDLKTFVTDLSVTERLASRIPPQILAVAESGLGTPSDLERLAEIGVTTFLVGESLMRQADVAAATRALIGARLPG